MALCQHIGELLDQLPKVSGQAGHINLGNDLNRLLNLTDKLAQQRGDKFKAIEEAFCGASSKADCDTRGLRGTTRVLVDIEDDFS